MLKIKKDFHFGDFEQQVVHAKEEATLRLPSQLKHVGRWGSEIALIQLISTWARKHGDSAVIKSFSNDTDSQTSREKQFSDYGNRLYGAAALYFTGKVISNQGTDIKKETWEDRFADLCKAMDQCDISSPSSVKATYPKSGDKVAAQFLCLHGNEYEFPHALYNEPTRSTGLINRENFNSLVNSALSANNDFNEFVEKKENLKPLLASLLYELFENTDEHGYEKVGSSESYKKNLRALSIKSHTYDLASTNLDVIRTNNPRFNSYLDFCTDQFIKRDRKVMRFLEFAVIDCGAGMAQRITGVPLTHIDINEEYKRTAECFKKGVTSKSSTSRGIGLDEVWNALTNLNGFIRLRTGRTSLFQTFHDLNLDSKKSFKKWTNEELEQVEGTAITVVIPCVY
jgi:glycerol-3-phosphate cytidylyltransferase-like family protein